MNESSAPEGATIAVFSTAKSWIESNATDQCRQVAALDGMRHVAGMPDLHAGKGAPVGAAMLSGTIYPHLVGSDIGCGIAVFPVMGKFPSPQRVASRIPDLDIELPANDELVVAAADNEFRAAWPQGWGTLGRGNHFAEFARVEEVLDASRAAELGLAAGEMVLIVHSGSRGWGEHILREHTSQYGAGQAANPDAYMQVHDMAARWAVANRRIIAARIAAATGIHLGEPIVDQCHNHVVACSGAWLHRKGAAPGDGCAVLVAGTRGSKSFIVAAHAGSDANFSVAHGAGRKMSRSDAYRRGMAKTTVAELQRTAVGSIVVCGDRQLLFEEAPDAYKRIEQVIADLVEHNLASPICSTVPVVTYKTADADSLDDATASRTIRDKERSVERRDARSRKGRR